MKTLKSFFLILPTIILIATSSASAQTTACATRGIQPIVMMVEASYPPKADISLCKEKADSKWTKFEDYVWNRTCRGLTANFNHFKEKNKIKNYRDANLLRSNFLETLLFESPFQKMIIRNGVRIIGARFNEKVDLSGGRIPYQLWLRDSLFENGLEMSRLTALDLIDLTGSKVFGELELARLRVGQALRLRGHDVDRKAYFEEANLRWVQVGGLLDMRNATFEEKAAFDGARIDDSINLSGSTFEKGFNLRNTSVGGSVFAADGMRSKGTASFTLTDIADQIAFDTATLNMIELNSASICGDVLVRDSSVRKFHSDGGTHIGRNFRMIDSQLPHVELTQLDVGGNLKAIGSDLCRFELTSSRIGAEFFLGTTDKTKKSIWKCHWPNPIVTPVPQLTLAHTDVKIVNGDLESAWPSDLQINGFSYLRFANAEKYIEDIKPFEAWLERHEPYVPQLYVQLAQSLDEAGHGDAADDIRYAGLERERDFSWNNAAYPSWLWSLLLRFTINYGYGYGYTYIVIWIATFSIIGTIVLYFTGEGRRNGMSHQLACLAYSLDMFLPLIRLREKHYQIDLKGVARYYFYFHQVFGFFLATYLVATFARISDL